MKDWGSEGSEGNDRRLPSTTSLPTRVRFIIEGEILRLVMGRQVKIEQSRKSLPSLPSLLFGQEPHMCARAKRSEVGNYLSAAKLFNMSARWPMPRRERLRIYYSSDKYKLRRDWGTWDRPPTPPEGISDEQVAKVNQLIAPRGWMLVKGRGGGWFPMRTI
jgi:hypothetical protein